MLKWLFLDIKRNLKTKKVFILLTTIFVSVFYYILNFDPIDKEYLDNLEDKFYLHVSDFMMIYDIDISDYEILEFYKLDKAINEVLAIQSNFDSFCIYYNYNFFKKEKNEDYYLRCRDFDNYVANVGNLVRYYKTNDEENYYKLKMAILNDTTDRFMDYYSNLKPIYQKSIKKHVLSFDEIFHIKEEVVNMNSSYIPFNVLMKSDSLVYSYNQSAKGLFESYYFNMSNYPLDVDYEVNFGFFLANYIDQYFILLIFTVVILIFDSYYRDFKSGVFKTILSSPNKRYKYIILKTLSTIISSLILIIAPLIIISIYLYIKVGYSGLSYPVYIRSNATTSFFPPLKFSNVINSISDGKDPFYYSTYRNICSYGPISKFPVDYERAIGTKTVDYCNKQMPYHTIKLIMLSEYLFYIISYFVLIVIFLSLLNTLFSVLLNNRILNLIVLSSFIGVGLFLLDMFYGSHILRFLPTTFLSPTKLLMLTIPYTYFNGIVVLLIYSLILAILSNFLINRKDFTF